MKLNKDSNYPNFWNTNGRRSDWLVAFDSYTKCLSHITNTQKWRPYPDSLAEYEFYKNVLATNSHVFKVHKPYDKFEAKLDELGLRADFEARTLDVSLYKKAKWFKNLNNGIENRARHFSSNLVTFWICFC